MPCCARSPTTPTCAAWSPAGCSRRWRRGWASWPAPRRPRLSPAPSTLSQAVIWAAVRDELRGADADLVAELTERLALVGELVRSAALRAVGPDAGVASAAAWPRPARAPRAAGPPVAAPPPVATTRPRPSAASAPRARRPAPPGRPAAAAPPPAARVAGPLGPADADPSRALWMSALEDEIVRSPGAPLSLLLAELEDADRVTAVEPRAEARATSPVCRGGAQRGAPPGHPGVRDRRPRLDHRARHRPWRRPRAGRADRGRGQVAAAWHGAPLVASVGVAVFGEDGRTSGELIEAAEEARFGAAADGADVVPAEPGDRGGRRGPRRQRGRGALRRGSALLGSETASICAVPSMPIALPVASVRSQSAPLA